jgi:hypothetical protein
VEMKLKALAQREAVIRNKAEKISAAFEVANYPSLFKETVKEMKVVEEDLAGMRYRNVLRHRGVLLKNLKDTRMFLSEQVVVNRDRSQALPNKMQDQILDAMGGASPKGYEELLKGYFQALSGVE